MADLNGLLASTETAVRESIDAFDEERMRPQTGGNIVDHLFPFGNQEFPFRFTTGRSAFPSFERCSFFVQFMESTLRKIGTLINVNDDAVIKNRKRINLYS